MPYIKIRRCLTDRGALFPYKRRSSQRGLKAEDFAFAGFLASFGPAIAESTERGIERQNHEFTASTQNNSTTSHHTHTHLLCAFTECASRCSRARWRLSQWQHRRRGKRAFGPHQRHIQYRSW